MLSASQLAAMQQTAAMALPDSGTILRASAPIPDGMGSGSTTWTAAATAPCRVRPSGLSGDERAVAGGISAFSYWRITFPAGTDVQETDRIQALGKTYEVIGSGVSSYEITRIVNCVEVG